MSAARDHEIAAWMLRGYTREQADLIVGADDGPYALPDEFEADDECDFTEEDVIT